MADLVLTGFHQKMRDLIGTAIDLGWSARQDPTHTARGNTSVLLHNYDGTVSIRVTPVRQINDAKLETMRRKVVRYADPVKRFAVAALLDQAAERGRDPVTQLIEALPSSAQAIMFETVPETERVVTGERPWLARKAASSKGGKVYESATAIERTWSDGSMDYICAFPGCGWTNVRARSVANHYGSAHTAKGETEPYVQTPTYPGHDYFEPLTHRPYRPSDRLVQALADWLAGHVTGDSTFTEWADAMLRWQHERPDLPDVEPTKRPPLSPEEILEEIRHLVGAPLASRLAEAEEAIAGLTTKAAELEAVVMARDAAIEHLRDERRALAALMADES